MKFPAADAQTVSIARVDQGAATRDLITFDAESGLPLGRLAESLKAYEGREVSLGIRPEHVGLVGHSDLPQGNNVLRGEVVVVESLGAQTDLIVDVAVQLLDPRVTDKKAA